MRKVLQGFVLIAFVGIIGSCNSVQNQIDGEWTVYKTALEHSDYTSATVALNRIVSIEKYNADALDSLCILYGKVGLNEAALTVGTKALAVRESSDVLKTVARANKNLGKYNLALQHYQKLLVADTLNFEFLYEMAFCNINLSQPSEAVTYLQKIIANPNSATAVMREFYQNGSQLVPYRAVAFNMLGFLQTQNGQDEDAFRSYQTSLSIYPNYELAKNNLRILEGKLAEN